MPDSMRDRLARRLYYRDEPGDAWEELPAGYRGPYYETVDAILAELETPDEAMVDAACVPQMTELGNLAAGLGQEDAVELWRSMIRSAREG